MEMEICLHLRNTALYFLPRGFSAAVCLSFDLAMILLFVSLILSSATAQCVSPSVMLFKVCVVKAYEEQFRYSDGIWTSLPSSETFSGIPLEFWTNSLVCGKRDGQEGAGLVSITHGHMHIASAPAFHTFPHGGGSNSTQLFDDHRVYVAS